MAKVIRAAKGLRGRGQSPFLNSYWWELFHPFFLLPSFVGFFSTLMHGSIAGFDPLVLLS